MHVNNVDEMPAEQCLDAAGPFVDGVFDVDGGITGSVRIPAMKYLSNLSTGDSKSPLLRKPSVTRSENLWPGAVSRGGLHRHGIKTRL